MIHVLLDGTLHYYRANLHCHSTISDGRKTPEELKTFYQKRGYSVLAYTDHDVFIPHNELTDESFVALNGYELNVDMAESKQTCHICYVALKEDNHKQAYFFRPAVCSGQAEKWLDHAKHDTVYPQPTYNSSTICDMMKTGREAGFFVTYNHPGWSLESYADYMSYDYMHAMEIQNYGCVCEGYNESSRIYDDMLHGGKRIFCIATDDNHNRHPDFGTECDSFGGYTMIGANALTYRAITAALEQGNFYCATGTSTHDGPAILSIQWDDESRTVIVKSSAARSIAVVTNTRPCCIANACDGETITQARLSIKTRTLTDFRVVVTDREGYRAFSNAYFVDSI